MRKGYFAMQLRLLVHDKKNRLFIGLALIAMVAYCAYFAAATQPPEALNIAATKIEARAIQDYLPKHGGAGQNPGIAGRMADEQAFLAALANHDRAKILVGMQRQLQRQDNQWRVGDDYSYPPVYYQDRGPNGLPRQDGHFNNQRMVARIRWYQQHRGVKVTVAAINERTFLQTLVRVSARWLPIAVALLAVGLSNRLVITDWRHETVEWGQPLSYPQRLVLKAATVWWVLLALVGAFIVMLATFTWPQAGLGSGLGVAWHVGAHFDFKVVSLARTLGWTALLTALLAWVWIRLTLLLQLVTRSEYVALLLGLLLLVTPAAYWQRGIGKFQPWTLNWLASYTEIGQVVTGKQAYLYDATSLTPHRALWVLLGWGLAIEVGIGLAVWRERRRGVAA